MACAAKFCTNSYRGNKDNEKKQSFHKFPLDAGILSKWIEFVGAPPKSKYSVLCSDHFNEVDFFVDTAGRKKIIPSAVPSVQGYFLGKLLHVREMK